MTTEPHFTAAAPIEFRYTPPETGESGAVATVLADGSLSGNADIVDAYETALAEWFDTTAAIAVNSGSSALHAALAAVGVGPGDEVLVPAWAPIPTALPILTAGARPVMVDTLPGRMGIDSEDLAAKISSRTKALLTCHLWGYPAEDAVARRTCAERGIPVIEDAAQAHGTMTEGRYAGTLGTIGAFSTHNRKMLSTGEGGFLLTDDRDLADKLARFVRLDKLSGERHGVNYKLAAPLAAIGHQRLTGLGAQIEQRTANLNRLRTAIPGEAGIRELPFARGGHPNGYNLVLTVPAKAARPIREHLAESGLPSDADQYGWSVLYQRGVFNDAVTHCPASEELVDTAVQLPVHPGLGEDALRWIETRLDSIGRLAKEHA